MTTKKPDQANDTQKPKTTQSEMTKTEATPPAPAPAVAAKPDVATVALVAKVNYAEKVELVRTQTTEKITALIPTITDENSQKGLQRLMQSTQPIKGREEMNRAWNIPIIRIAYGTTKDPGKPASCKPGDMFSTNGRKIDPPFVFTPLYMFESNRMFQDNQAQPTCWSPDGKWGTTFGDCLKCPNLPLGKNKSGAKTDCNNGISAVVLGKDMQVYRLEFFKTSRRAGSHLDKLTQSGTALWERWFELSSQTINKDNYEYAVFKVAPEGSDVPEQIKNVCNTLYDYIDVERKSFVYHFENKYKNGDTSGNNAPIGEGVDESAMMGGPGPVGDTNPDLSESGM